MPPRCVVTVISKRAAESGEQRFWHEYFYELVLTLDDELFEGDPGECWLLAAAKANLPLVVPGYEDSTFGNIFASHVAAGDFDTSVRFEAGALRL